jgi:hypothetical protein
MHEHNSSGSRTEATDSAAIVDARLLAGPGDLDYDGEEDPPPADPPPTKPDYPGGGDGTDLPSPGDNGR